MWWFHQDQTHGEQEFYAKSSASDDEDDDDETKDKKENDVYIMDPDHRLLLRNCKPLLQSRNASVSTSSTMFCTVLHLICLE